MQTLGLTRAKLRGCIDYFVEKELKGKTEAAIVVRAGYWVVVAIRHTTARSAIVPTTSTLYADRA